MKKHSWILLIPVFLGACVPYEGTLPPEALTTTLNRGPFRELDPGASELESLHFKIRAYGSDNTKQVSELAEADYNRIMLDTNLYSFHPTGLYEIVVYGSADEYHKKTSQPDWSGGATVGNAIYTYVSPALAGTLAHEMTHLIFFEYMGRVTIDHRWVNEGLAVYEEMAALGGRGDMFPSARASMRQLPLPMDQMIHLVPATEREKTVSVWYCEAESMVQFMVERGGRIGFSQFLDALKNGRSFDEAFPAGFAQWRSLADFEREWLRAQQ